MQANLVPQHLRDALSHVLGRGMDAGGHRSCGRESPGLEVEDVLTPVVGSDGGDTPDSADDVEME